LIIIEKIPQRGITTTKQISTFFTGNIFITKQHPNKKIPLPRDSEKQVPFAK
jgi:hypothetical protein